MRTKKIAASQTSRLQTGAAILAAARTVDTRPIQARLTRFERAHQGYLDAHRKVEVAEAQLRAARAGVSARDAEQDRAVETLACALVNDGQPRISPFAAFDAPSPTALAHLSVRDQATAVHTLVSALQRHAGISKATLTVGSSPRQGGTRRRAGAGTGGQAGSGGARRASEAHRGSANVDHDSRRSQARRAFRGR